MRRCANPRTNKATQACYTEGRHAVYNEPEPVCSDFKRSFCEPDIRALLSLPLHHRHDRFRMCSLSQFELADSSYRIIYTCVCVCMCVCMYVYICMM
jgi:hypothetical protein